jgi:hypothetical protein
MPTYATEIIEQSERKRVIDRKEICLPEINAVRATLLRMIRFLCEVNDDYDIDYSNTLSVSRNRLLTEPVYFSEHAHELGKLLQQFHAPQHYGDRFHQDYKKLLLELERLTLLDNPLHQLIADNLEDAVTSNSNMKIWCYRHAREAYRRVAQEKLRLELNEDWFIHSVSMYEELRPFNDLLLVGPLRARGWNRVPDVIVSAPRFETLRQLIWDGMSDDPHLGYDPVLQIRQHVQEADIDRTDADKGVARPSMIQRAFVSNVYRVGNSDAVDDPFELEDEFQWQSNMREEDRMSRAMIMTLSNGTHVCWAPRTKLLSYSRSDVLHPVAARSALVDLTAGMYVVIEIDAGQEGHDVLDMYESMYTHAWRAKLQQRIESDPKDLVRKLRMRGLNLKTLPTRVLLWATVDAPRKQEHFEILIDELGLANYDPERKVMRHGANFATRAFKVISKGWGKAISLGREVSERIENKRTDLLNSAADELSSLSQESDKFDYTLCTGEESDGVLQFNKLVDIEYGFMVPNEYVREIVDRTEVDKWRL